MLEHGVDATAADSLHESCGERAREQRILGEVFEGASAEGGAMAVQGRRAPAAVAGLERLLAERGAHLAHELGVPGLRLHVAAREGGVVLVLGHVDVCEARGSVGLDGLGLAHGADLVAAVDAAAHELLHLARPQLVDEQVPGGVVQVASA